MKQLKIWLLIGALAAVLAIAALRPAHAAMGTGTVVAWGCQNGQDYGQCTIPAGLSGVTAVSAGSTHSLALKSAGTVAAWGCSGSDFGQCAVPSGLISVTAP